MDQWAKIEFLRLQWVKSNQKTIRAKKKRGLYNALMEGESVSVARKVILPPTICDSTSFADFLLKVWDGQLNTVKDLRPCKVT